MGPVLLRGGLGGLSGGGGGGTTNNGHNDDDDFDDDDETSVKEGDDGRKVTISLPTFPPDADDEDDEEDNGGSNAGSAAGNGTGPSAGTTSTATSVGTSTTDSATTADGADGQSDINTIAGDQPNVSSNHDVEVDANQTMEIDSGDQSTVKQPDTQTSHHPIPSSPSSSDHPQQTTQSPLTLTGFNRENAVPHGNLVFADAGDASENAKGSADPAGAYQLIDIRGGFDSAANAPTTLPNTSTETTNENSRK